MYKCVFLLVVFCRLIAAAMTFSEILFTESHFNTPQHRKLMSSVCCILKVNIKNVCLIANAKCFYWKDRWKLWSLNVGIFYVYLDYSRSLDYSRAQNIKKIWVATFLILKKKPISWPTYLCCKFERLYFHTYTDMIIMMFYYCYLLCSHLVSN